MKAAWGDFGKTLAWTGAVWYGGEAVKRFSNDIKSNIDLPNYVDSLKKLSIEEGKSGMYDGFVSIYKKIGGGIMPGTDGQVTGFVEGLLPSTVPAHQFKEMWDVLCTGRQGNQFLDCRISDLSDALQNKYHSTKKGDVALGSHVGGVREFFYDMGQWGKDVYDKFLIDDKTGNYTRKLLWAIADYRSTDSFKDANDAIPDRNHPISDLFATPLSKQTDVAANISPEMEAFNKSLKDAGYATLRILPAAGELGADVWKVTMNGVEYLFRLPKEILTSLTPAECESLMSALKILGVAGAVAGGIWGITLLPSMGALGL